VNVSSQPTPPAAIDDRRPGETDSSVAAYAAAVAARQPAPGGGSVLGVTAALAAGLGSMVCRFSAPAGDDAQLPPGLTPVLAELDQLREEALRLATADEGAYGSYRVASAMPKSTDEERAARRGAMREALVASTEVPLAVATTSQRILTLLDTVAEAGNAYLRSDAEIGSFLAAAALRGSLINVRGNVAMLKDPSAAERFATAADALEQWLADRVTT
jgi:formiminotetrahydrofolate cyclodeaminase